MILVIAFKCLRHDRCLVATWRLNKMSSFGARAEHLSSAIMDGASQLQFGVCNT